MECLKFMKDVFITAFFLMLKKILSNFISAYEKSYSSNHVLLRLIKKWTKSRDNKNFVGTVLMVSPRLLIVFLMIYLLQNLMHMVYHRKH